jgi:hypothetical protein
LEINAMSAGRRFFAILITAATVLLTGCATTLRSDVTAFHEWPAQLTDKSYVFEAAPPPQDTLEYRSYLNILRSQLSQLGFSEAGDPNGAKLKVAMRFSTVDRPERIVEAVDPFWTGPGYWPGRYYGAWGRPGFGRYYGYGYYNPFYSPLMYGPMDLRETIRHNYERELRVAINTVEGKKLFDVTVHNTSGEQATPIVMPALIASAFAGFPGQSGVPHRVTLTLDDKGQPTKQQ